MRWGGISDVSGAPSREDVIKTVYDYNRPQCSSNLGEVGFIGAFGQLGLQETIHFSFGNLILKAWGRGVPD